MTLYHLLQCLPWSVAWSAVLLAGQDIPLDYEFLEGRLLSVSHLVLVCVAWFSLSIIAYTYWFQTQLVSKQSQGSRVLVNLLEAKLKQNQLQNVVHPATRGWGGAHALNLITQGQVGGDQASLSYLTRLLSENK